MQLLDFGFPVPGFSSYSQALLTFIQAQIITATQVPKYLDPLEVEQSSEISSFGRLFHRTKLIWVACWFHLYRIGIALQLFASGVCKSDFYLHEQLFIFQFQKQLFSFQLQKQLYTWLAPEVHVQLVSSRNSCVADQLWK